MEFRRVERYMEGYMPVVEAAEECCLLGGHPISDGAVYDNYSDALFDMHAVVKNNILANRSVKSGKVVPFKGMVDCHEVVKPEKAGYFLEIE